MLRPLMEEALRVSVLIALVVWSEPAPVSHGLAQQAGTLWEKNTLCEKVTLISNSDVCYQ